MAETRPEFGRCTETGCSVASTGKCQDGLRPSECPTFVAVDRLDVQDTRQEATEATSVESENVEASGRRSGWVQLARGEALHLRDVRHIGLRSIPRTVLIAGAHKAGKTTLLTSAYEAFLQRRFPSLYFCGSATLPAFEQRCFLNRPESGGLRPDTARTTPTAEPRFLHLRIAREKEIDRHVDLLLADISGEDFEAIVNEATAMEKVLHLDRVDHLTIVIDGEKLTDGRRWAEERSVRHLLARFIESQGIPPDSSCHLVVTKADLISADPDYTDEDVETLLNGLEKRASEYFTSVTRHVIAARPTCEVESGRRDLAPLLLAWMASYRPLPIGV